MRTARVAVTALALVTLAGCGSSGGSSGSSTPPASGPTGSTSGSTGSTPSTPSGSTATMTFTGSFSGSVSVNLCSGPVASIKVTVKGDSTTYNGSISATEMGFVGPAAADYTLKEGDAKPTVSADGNTFTVHNATLIDLISKKSVVVNGSVTCP
ncbi:MAG: hypothetical protein JWP74_1691 [Marmoricola sp.]|nr:hypothetical protein [Marmoricola sp.]